MNPEKLKGYVYTFIIGGAIGAVGQVILKLYFSIGLKPLDAIQLMVLTMAVLGAVLTVLGVYGKLTELGGMGAMMPMCGLSAGIAGVIAGQRANGVPAGEAVKIGMSAPIQIFAVGTLVAFLVALAKHFIGA